MAITAFDTLKFANTLKAAGVPDKQAEAQASVLGEALAVNFKDLATKEDLTAAIRESEQRLSAKIDSLGQQFSAKVDSLEHRLDAKIDGLEHRLDAKIDGLEHRLDAKIDNQSAKYDGQFTLLKWMLGLTISINIGLLIRAFFFGRMP